MMHLLYKVSLQEKAQVKKKRIVTASRKVFLKP